MITKSKHLIFTTLVILLLTVTVVLAENDPVTQARSLIEQKKFGEAFTLLKNRQRDKNTPDSLRFEILKLLAVSYEEKVGAYQTALRYYQDILKSPAAVNYPVFAFAEKETARLRELQKSNYQEDQFLKKVRFSSLNSMQLEELEAQKKQLFDFIDKQPQYYRMTEVYYCLAQNFTVQEQFGKAYQYYKKSIQLKPAVDFFLPVSSRSRFVLKERNRIIAHTSAWTSLAFLIIATMIAFYSSRPWQWLNLRHVLVMGGMLSLWWLVFTISSFITGEVYQVSDKILTEIHAELPAFVKADPGSPGSEILRILFGFGAVGLVGVCIFSMGISRYKNRIVANSISVLYGLLLFCTLITIFYMRYCDGKSKFNSQGQNLVHYIAGNSYFNLTEHKAFVLTDPNSYSNLEISNVDEPELANWILTHCKFDSSKLKKQ